MLDVFAVPRHRPRGRSLDADVALRDGPPVRKDVMLSAEVQARPQAEKRTQTRAVPHQRRCGADTRTAAGARRPPALPEDDDSAERGVSVLGQRWHVLNEVPYMDAPIRADEVRRRCASSISRVREHGRAKRRQVHAQARHGACYVQCGDPSDRSAEAVARDDDVVWLSADADQGRHELRTDSAPPCQKPRVRATQSQTRAHASHRTGPCGRFIRERVRERQSEVAQPVGPALRPAERHDGELFAATDVAATDHDLYARPHIAHEDVVPRSPRARVPVDAHGPFDREIEDRPRPHPATSLHGDERTHLWLASAAAGAVQNAA